MKKLLISLLVALSMTTYGHASEPPKDAEKPDSYYEKIPADKCTERGFGHYEENKCLGVWMGKLDKQLDYALNKWLAEIDDAYKDLLPSQEAINELKKKARESQDAWDFYRKKHCGLQADFVIGTGSGAEYGTCYIRMAKERLKFLRNRSVQ